MMRERRVVMNNLIVAEQFYSIQGEGRTLGIPAFFLRLAGCNLMCGGRGTDHDKKLHHGATWRCDTIEVWKKGKAKPFDAVISDFCNIQGLTMGMVHELISEGYAHLVITGGEPLMQMENIIDFCNWMADELDWHPVIEIETNGTIIPSGRLDTHVNYYNVSPKLANSGEPEQARFNSKAMRFYAESTNAGDHKAIFKFVVGNQNDVDEVITQWIHRFDLPPRQCYLMPAADNEKQLREVSQFVAEICKAEGLRFSTRMHLAIWDKKTGV